MSDPVDIAYWLRIDERLTSSGQPSEAQLAAISKLGVRHMINLALHSHEKALPDEAGTVAALGMEYIHIPVEFEAPTEQDFALFCAAMEHIGQDKVHVHCILNARVSAFLYRWRRDVMDLPEAEARAAMEQIWQPGGVWAAFIGDEDAVDRPHGWRPQRD